MGKIRAILILRGFLLAIGLLWHGQILAQSPINIPGLVARYPFNGNANDQSGNGHHGTVTGATLTTDRFGQPNRAYSFDGNNDFIDLGNKPAFNFGVGNFTFSVWFKSRGAQIDKYIIGKYNSPNPPSYGLGTGQRSDAYLFFRAPNNNGGFREVRGQVNLSDGNWHHMVGTYDRAVNATMYVDGVAIRAVTIAIAPGNITSNINLFVGKIQTGQHFGGEIDAS